MEETTAILISQYRWSPPKKCFQELCGCDFLRVVGSEGRGERRPPLRGARPKTGPGGERERGRDPSEELQGLGSSPPGATWGGGCGVTPVLEGDGDGWSRARHPPRPPVFYLGRGEEKQASVLGQSGFY